MKLTLRELEILELELRACELSLDHTKFTEEQKQKIYTEYEKLSKKLAREIERRKEIIMILRSQA